MHLAHRHNLVKMHRFDPTGVNFGHKKAPTSAQLGSKVAQFGPKYVPLVGFIAQLTDMKLSQSDVATFCNAGLTKVVSYQEDYTAQCIGLSHTLGHIACVSLHVCWYLPTFFSRVPS